MTSIWQIVPQNSQFFCCTIFPCFPHWNLMTQESLEVHCHKKKWVNQIVHQPAARCTWTDSALHHTMHDQPTPNDRTLQPRTILQVSCQCAHITMIHCCQSHRYQGLHDARKAPTPAVASMLAIRAEANRAAMPSGLCAGRVRLADMSLQSGGTSKPACGFETGPQGTHVFRAIKWTTSALQPGNVQTIHYRFSGSMTRTSSLVWPQAVNDEPLGMRKGSKSRTHQKCSTTREAPILSSIITLGRTALTSLVCPVSFWHCPFPTQMQYTAISHEATLSYLTPKVRVL